jgi:riboflavin biosynthesis pyrimidine reductase
MLRACIIKRREDTLGTLEKSPAKRRKKERGPAETGPRVDYLSESAVSDDLGLGLLARCTAQACLVGRALHGLGCVRVLVEGGGRVHGAFLQARLADELCLYLATGTLLGRGRPWLAAPSPTLVEAAHRLDAPQLRRFGDDLRIRARIRYPAAPCSPA